MRTILALAMTLVGIASLAGQSMAQADYAAEEFKKIDKNKDDLVDLEELVDYMIFFKGDFSLDSNSKEYVQRACEWGLELADKNKDGKLALTEFIFDPQYQHPLTLVIEEVW